MTEIQKFYDAGDLRAFPDCGFRLGMSLRDYFAAKALPAIIPVCVEDTPNGIGYMDCCAALAYKYADAMLKARGG